MYFLLGALGCPELDHESSAKLSSNSDGIARVHGMNNVQAEELVE